MMTSHVSKSNSSFLDTGASHHIVKDKRLLNDYEILPKVIRLETSKKGVYLNLVGRGTLEYSMESQTVTITEVYFSPDANANLISNAVFDSKGGKTRIEKVVVELFTKYDELFLRGLKR